MKTKNLLLILFAFVLASCKKEFEKINNNVSESDGILVSGNQQIPIMITSGNMSFTAFNAQTGNQISYFDNLYNINGLKLTQAPLLIHNYLIFFLGNIVTAVDINTSHQSWSDTLGESITEKKMYATSDPFFSGDTMYFSLKYYTKQSLLSHAIYSMNLKNGKIIWSKNISSFSIPFITGSDKYLLYSLDNLLYSVNKNSGETVWQFSSSASVLNPCIYKEDVYVAVNTNDVYHHDTIFALKLVDGGVAWNREIYDLGFNASPVCKNDRLYLNIKGGIQCFEPKSGKTIWKTVLKKGYSFSPIFIYKDKLYSTTGYNNYLFAADTANGAALWNVNLQPFATVNLIEGPIVLNDLVYVRGDHEMDAFDYQTGIKKWTTIVSGNQLFEPQFKSSFTNEEGFPVFYTSTGMQ